MWFGEKCNKKELIKNNESGIVRNGKREPKISAPFFRYHENQHNQKLGPSPLYLFIYLLMHHQKQTVLRFIEL
jgi:hypothetical protein